jgi:Caudovirales tail fibre assembly protein.
MKPIVYKGWESYDPPETEENKFHIFHGAKFLRNKDGQDWYDVRKELMEKYEGYYFLLVDSNTDIVRFITIDPSGLFPHNTYIVIVDELSDEIKESPYFYKFSKGKFVPDNTFKIQQLEIYLSEEISWASSQISALDDISLFGTPTDEEKERLDALRKYRFTLVRTKPEDNPDIDLPDRP